MKFDPITFINTLMGRGLTWEHASCAVTLFDVMLRDDRRNAAERSRKHREKRKAAEAAAKLRALSLSSSLNSSIELKENPRKEVSKKEKRKKSTSPFPEDFRPTDLHYARGLRLGFSHSDIDDMAEDIALWAKAKGEKKACWNSAFHRWIRTQRKRTQNGNPAKQNWTETLERLDDALDAAGRKTGEENVVRLIPQREPARS